MMRRLWAVLGMVALGCQSPSIPGPVRPLPGGRPGAGRIQSHGVPGGVVGQEARRGTGSASPPQHGGHAGGATPRQ